MARRFRLIIPVLSGALLLAVHSVQADPIWNVVDRPIVSPDSLDLDEIGRRMMLAAARRGWDITNDGQQRLRARIATGSGRYEAVVGITYTDKVYSMTLLESKGFGQRGDSIDGRANRWIRNLEEDIAKAFVRAPRPLAARSVTAQSETVPEPIARPESRAFPPVRSSGSR